MCACVCFRSGAARVPFYVSLLILPLERIDAATAGKSGVRRATQPIMVSWQRPIMGLPISTPLPPPSSSAFRFQPATYFVSTFRSTYFSFISFFFFLCSFFCRGSARLVFIGGMKLFRRCNQSVEINRDAGVFQIRMFAMPGEHFHVSAILHRGSNLGFCKFVSCERGIRCF